MAEVKVINFRIVDIRYQWPLFGSIEKNWKKGVQIVLWTLLPLTIQSNSVQLNVEYHFIDNGIEIQKFVF